MKLNDMKIYIVAMDIQAYYIFNVVFRNYDNIEIVNLDFESFMETYKDVECIVSPANSYGCMDGGYDAAISNYLGWDFQLQVQQYIKDNFYGEQIVGTSFIIDAPKNKKLIHTPTMIFPEPIVDKRIAYTSMRSTLICALKNNIKTIAIPPLGAGIGEIRYEEAAILMLAAYKQILDAEGGVYSYYHKRK